MKFKPLLRWILVGCIAMVVLVPGVFATWRYSYLPVGSQGIELNNTLVEFYYKPEELLPGDDDATELHENHLRLIENIVNHIDYGLNATKKPIVLQLLKTEKDKVYSDQNVQGGNLKHMLLDSSDVENLMFVVEYVTDTEFAAYTFSGVKASYSNMDSFIEVYKTQILYENGRWKATRSFTGQSKVFRPGIVDISVNVDTWIST